MLPAPRLNVAATYTQTMQRMGPRHEGSVEIAKEGNIDVLLDGDSITDWWVQGEANKAMFEKYFGGYRTANFAIAGDTTQGVLWGLKNGEGQGFQPKAIMLMIGTNNTGGTNNAGTATAAEIAEGVERGCSGDAERLPPGEDSSARDLSPWGAGRFGARQDRGDQPAHLQARRSA
jgi:lysophospholipase L1-like esterase